LRDAVQRYVGGETDAIPEIQEAAEGYLQLLGHHMGIEEGVLFELAERVVSDEDDAAMTDELEKVARAYRESGDQARIAAALDSLQQYAPASAL
jgi:hemerythrin-like domain-containing protein